MMHIVDVRSEIKRKKKEEKGRSIIKLTKLLIKLWCCAFTGRPIRHLFLFFFFFFLFSDFPASLRTTGSNQGLVRRF